MSEYIADVKRYDSGADEAIVAKIVRHLGIALRNRDSSLVSCSDPTELNRVKESWCGKKLGVSSDAADDVIAKTCEVMSGDRAKTGLLFTTCAPRNSGSSRTFRSVDVLTFWFS